MQSPQVRFDDFTHRQTPIQQNLDRYHLPPPSMTYQGQNPNQMKSHSPNYYQLMQANLQKDTTFTKIFVGGKSKIRLF